MGMPRTESKTIGGLNVSVTQFMGRRALRLTARIIRTLGPAIVPLIEARGKFGDADAGSLLYALSNLSDDAADELACAILAGTTVTGGESGKCDLSDPAKIDLAFGSDLLTMCKAMLFALEINYQNFTEGLSTTLGALLSPKAQSPSA